MKPLVSIIAGGALLVSASLVHAASPGLGGPSTNTTTPGAIGGTQQSLQPTGRAGAGGANPTAPTVDTAPGTAGGPDYSPSTDAPAPSESAGTAGTNGG